VIGLRSEEYFLHDLMTRSFINSIQTLAFLLPNVGMEGCQQGINIVTGMLESVPIWSCIIERRFLLAQGGNIVVMDNVSSKFWQSFSPLWCNCVCQMVKK